MRLARVCCRRRLHSVLVTRPGEHHVLFTPCSFGHIGAWQGVGAAAAAGPVLYGLRKSTGNDRVLQPVVVASRATTCKAHSSFHISHGFRASRALENGSTFFSLDGDGKPTSAQPWWMVPGTNSGQITKTFGAFTWLVVYFPSSLSSGSHDKFAARSFNRDPSTV